MKRTYYPTVVILNSDIIDGWHLYKKSHRVWNRKHIFLFRVILKMTENFGTEIIYIRGNHDDFLDSLMPINFYYLNILKTSMPMEQNS